MHLWIYCSALLSWQRSQRDYILSSSWGFFFFKRMFLILLSPAPFHNSSYWSSVVIVVNHVINKLSEHFFLVLFIDTNQGKRLRVLESLPVVSQILVRLCWRRTALLLASFYSVKVVWWHNGRGNRLDTQVVDSIACVCRSSQTLLYQH